MDGRHTIDAFACDSNTAGSVAKLRIVEAVDTRAGDEWDAATAAAVAGLINGYLRENPPPPDAATGVEWRRYATTLMAQANVRLRVVRARSDA